MGLTRERGTTTVVAVAVSALFLGVLAVGMLLQARSRGLSGADVVNTVPLLVAQAVGLLLAVRRPSNRVGWIVCGLAWALSAQTLLTGYGATRSAGAPSSMEVAAAWLNGKWFLLLWGGIIALFLHFPDGRLPSPRWRWAGRAAATAVAFGVIAFAAAPRPLHDDLPLSAANPLNPTAVPDEVWRYLSVIEPVGIVLLVAGLVAALASLVVRYRTSTPVVRLQIRWVVAAAVLLALALLLNVVVRSVDERWLQFADLVAGLAFSLLPLSVGIAVLRYRLYDIDRVVSRTVGWVVVTVVTAGVYIAAVAAATTMLSPATGRSPAAVAAATLAAAAVFGRIHHRTQTAVDRRFNRARYDAVHTIEAFSGRLRDEVDLATLRRELIDVVDMTMHPAATTLWLREAGR